MKVLIKQALHKFGFELKKTNHRPEFLDRITSEHRTKGLIVEFVGFSGIGKTTLFKKIFKEHWHNWFSKHNLRYLFNNKKEEPFCAIDDFAEIIYTELLRTKYDYLYNSNLKLERKSKLYDFFLKVLEYDAFFKYFDIPKGLFSDGDIIHNFKPEIIKIHSNSDIRNIANECFNYLFLNRSIISFEASTNYIINNLKKRSIENPNSANDWYAIYGYRKIKRLLEEELANQSKLLSIADGYKASILKLNIETDMQSENIRKVNNFITGIMNKHYPEQKSCKDSAN